MGKLLQASQLVERGNPKSNLWNPRSATGGEDVKFPSAVFQNQGSSIVTGAALTGDNSTDSGVDIFVPNLYTAWDVSDRVKIGLGINSPFGLKTK